MNTEKFQGQKMYITVLTGLFTAPGTASLVGIIPATTKILLPRNSGPLGVSVRLSRAAGVGGVRPPRRGAPLRVWRLRNPRALRVWRLRNPRGPSCVAVTKPRFLQNWPLPVFKGRAPDLRNENEALDFGQRPVLHNTQRATYTLHATRYMLHATPEWARACFSV